MHCDGKQRYPSERVAMKAIRNREHQGATKLRAYKCPTCFGWHMSKMPIKDFLLDWPMEQRK